MRYPLSIVALGAALAAAPAAAQVNVGAGGQVGANVGVGADTGGLLGGVTDTLGRTVGTVDRTMNRGLQAGLRAATHADLRAGANVRDGNGRSIGVVQSVHGNTAVIVRGNQAFHVPIAALYRSGEGLVTSLTDAQLRASATANARAGVHAGH